ncbi:MAG: hypothetical protein JWL95_24 [Gemmatimonadetes bacterium]|nr:hypothetical protein [Gemmatimonadota bacterium]
MTPPLVIGFTGTREGMTAAQLAAVRALLVAAADRPLEVHHGDCLGADAEFDALAREVTPAAERHIHPPTDIAKAAACWIGGGCVLYPPFPYLQRDRHIVDACRVLIATPRGVKEELRSGTWMTVRYARAKGKARRIVWPDGTVTHDPTPTR